MTVPVILLVVLSVVSISLAQDTCESWQGNYRQHCMQSHRSTEIADSCQRYEQLCLSNSGGVCQPSSGESGGFAAKFQSLTQQAQCAQAKQAYQNALKGQTNCGQYSQNYNVWCSSSKPLLPGYCKLMSGVCTTQQQQWASGQGGVNGNAFNSGNGLPTGGGGSVRPFTMGRNTQVGPFVGFGRTFGFNPLQGGGTERHVDVPLIGFNVGQTKSVDYGGMLGVAQLGQFLQGGRRRRRWAHSTLYRTQ